MMIMTYYKLYFELLIKVNALKRSTRKFKSILKSFKININAARVSYLPIVKVYKLKKSERMLYLRKNFYSLVYDNNIGYLDDILFSRSRDYSHCKEIAYIYIMHDLMCDF